jgi:hypothetical protein
MFFGKRRPVSESADKTLVRELAEQIVAEVAPDEVEMFPALADVYLADPKRVLSRSCDREESLGFGVGEVELLLTPAAVYVAAAVMDHLSDAIGRGVVYSGKQVIARLTRGWRNEKPVARQAVPLTSDQLRDVRRVALEKGREAGLDDKTARAFADTVVAGLALGPDQQPPADGDQRDGA